MDAEAANKTLMKRTRYLSLVKHITTVQPAVRTVVVLAWYTSDESCGEHVCPVLAIETRVEGKYWWRGEYLKGQRPPPGPPEGASHKECLEFGWNYSGELITRSPIITGIYGCSGLESYDLASIVGDEAFHLVACPWPPDQDEERLKEVMAAVKKEARDRAATRAIITPKEGS